MPLRAIRFLLLGIVGFAPVVLPAQTYVWTGTTDGNWATGTNWDTGTPVSGTTTVLSFDTAMPTTMANNIGGGLTLNQLTFSSVAGATTLSGNALIFDGTSPTLVNNAIDAADVRIAVPVTLNQTLTITGGPTIDAQLIFVTGSGISGTGGLIWAGGIGFNNIASSYTGQTQILGGVYGTNQATGLGVNASASVSSGGSLQLQGGVTINKALSIAGEGFTGHSALESSTGGGTWSGLVTLASNAKVGAFGNSTLTLSGGTALGANTLTVNPQSGSIVTLTGAITGTGGVTKTGAGTAFFSSSGSNYTGATLISAGTARVTNANGFGATSLVTVSSGANLVLSGTTVARPLSLAGQLSADSSSGSWSGPITLAGNATLSASGATSSEIALQISGGLDLNGSTLTLAPDTSSGRNVVRLASAVTGTGAINVAVGTGTVVFAGSGVSTFTGPVSIAGSVALGLGDNFGNIANTVTFAGGTLVTFENTATIGARPWVLAGTGGLSLVPSNLSHTIGANISGAGPFTVTSVGSGTGGIVTLSGTNTFTGGLVVGSSSSIRVSADAALGASGGAITLAGGGLSFLADMSLSPTRSVTLTSSNGTITAPAGVTATVAGNLDGAGRLTIGGGSGGNIGGTVILSGTNTHSGGVVLNGATLALGSDAALGGSTGVFNITGNSAVLATGGFTVAATRSTTFSNLKIDTNGFDVTFAQSLTGTGIEKNGAGVLRFDAANASSSTNQVMLNAGTLRAGIVNAFGAGTSISAAAGTVFDLNGFSQNIRNVSGSGEVHLGSGTLTMRTGSLVENVISGTGGVVLESGSFIFTGSNTFSGGITVQQGATLALANTTALGASGGSITVDNGQLSTSSFGTGPVEIDSSLALTIGAGGVTFGASGHSLVISRVLSGTVPIAVTGGDDGYEVQFANANNTFVRNLQLGAAGSPAVLGIAANGSLGATGNTITLGDYFFDGESHRTGTGTLRALADLTLPASRVVAVKGHATHGGGGILDTNGFTMTVDGAISQTTAGIGLQKRGAGTLLLNGASSFTGTMRVSSGTLGGTGSLAGGLLVETATLSPGASAGLFTVGGNLTLSSGSLTLMELGGTLRGSGYDALNIGGAFAADGTLTVNLISGYTPAGGSSFLLFSAGSYSGGFATLNLPTLADGLAWNDTQLANAGIITVTGSAIPEPSTYALIAGCAGLFLAWRRRSRAKQSGDRASAK